jgi:hypothetical protein
MSLGVEPFCVTVNVAVTVCPAVLSAVTVTCADLDTCAVFGVRVRRT